MPHDGVHGPFVAATMKPSVTFCAGLAAGSSKANGGHAVESTYGENTVAVAALPAWGLVVAPNNPAAAVTVAARSSGTDRRSLRRPPSTQPLRTERMEWSSTLLAEHKPSKLGKYPSSGSDAQAARRANNALIRPPSSAARPAATLLDGSIRTATVTPVAGKNHMPPLTM